MRTIGQRGSFKMNKLELKFVKKNLINDGPLPFHL